MYNGGSSLVIAKVIVVGMGIGIATAMDIATALVRNSNRHSHSHTSSDGNHNDSRADKAESSFRSNDRVLELRPRRSQRALAEYLLPSSGV